MNEIQKEKIRVGVLKAVALNPDKFKKFKGHGSKTMEIIKPKISKSLTKHGLYTTIKARKKLPCEICGKLKSTVHHKNGDEFDNRIENLKNLCKSCHTKEHYIVGTKTGKMGNKKVPIIK